MLTCRVAASCPQLPLFELCNIFMRIYSCAHAVSRPVRLHSFMHTPYACIHTSNLRASCAHAVSIPLAFVHAYVLRMHPYVYSQGRSGPACISTSGMQACIHSHRHTRARAHTHSLSLSHTRASGGYCFVIYIRYQPTPRKFFFGGG